MSAPKDIHAGVVAWRVDHQSALGHGTIKGNWRDGCPSDDDVSEIEEFTPSAVIHYAYAAPQPQQIAEPASQWPDLQKQESLGEPFDKVLHDNLWGLYTDEPTQAGVQWQCGPQASGFTQPDTHAQELTAYEITVGNLRAEIAALRCALAGTAPAPSKEYAELPEHVQTGCGPDFTHYFSAHQMHAFADATHALRTGEKT